jgi:hypothetical protein
MKVAGSWSETGAEKLPSTPERTGGSAWESNPPPMPQPAPDNGFEDRRRHQPPSASVEILAQAGRFALRRDGGRRHPGRAGR